MEVIKTKMESDQIDKSTLFMYSVEMEWKSENQDVNDVNGFLNQFVALNGTAKLWDNNLSECDSSECEYDDYEDEYYCNHEGWAYFPTQSIKYKNVYALRYYYDGSVDRELVIGSNDIVELNQIVQDFCSSFKFDYDREGLHLSMNLGLFNPYKLLYHMNTLNSMYCFTEFALLHFNNQKHRNNEYANPNSSMMSKGGYPSMLINKQITNSKVQILYDDIERPRGKLGKKWYKDNDLSFKDFINNDNQKLLNKFVEFRFCNPKTRPFLQVYFAQLPQLFNDLDDEEISNLGYLLSNIDFQTSNPNDVLLSRSGKEILEKTRLGKMLSFFVNGINNLSWLKSYYTPNNLPSLVTFDIDYYPFIENLVKQVKKYNEENSSYATLTDNNKDHLRTVMHTLENIIKSDNIRIEGKKYKNKVFFNSNNISYGGNRFQVFHYSTDIDDNQAIFKQLFLLMIKYSIRDKEMLKMLPHYTDSYENFKIFIEDIKNDHRLSLVYRVVLEQLLDEMISIPKLIGVDEVF
jgi:hypothetical protein